MRIMKKASAYLLTENIGETGCLEHALEQNTNDEVYYNKF